MPKTKTRRVTARVDVALHRTKDPTVALHGSVGNGSTTLYAAWNVSNETMTVRIQQSMGQRVRLGLAVTSSPTTASWNKGTLQLTWTHAW